MNDSDRKRIKELRRTAECGLKFQSWGNASEVMREIPFLIELVEKQEKQIAVMREALIECAYEGTDLSAYDRMLTAGEALAEVEKMEKEKENE